MLHVNKIIAHFVFKKRSIHLVIPFTLLIMCCTLNGYAQETSDTLVVNAKDIDKPIYYSAKDSIYTDLIEKKVHLYNEATVDNGEVKIEAGYIMIDLDSNEVYARYSYDKDSNRVQLPKFTDGAEQIEAASIRYNFDTKKGFIKEVAIQQDENYLYMEVAKRHNNDEIHFLKGRFTTCDLEEPHYHFQLSKAVMIPNKRIVSGPMNLWVQGVPTFIGLPFAIIPQVEEKSRGFMFPQIVPLSQYGFGFQDLGYYLPINDKLQTTFFGSLYSRGSWGLRNKTDYAVRYKFKGQFNAGFQQFRSGFPDNFNRNKLSVNWQHYMDSKANPYWNFNANVNFVSDNNNQNTLDPLSTTYFNNTLNSDINIKRSFPGKPITSGLKLSLKQNSISQNIAVTAPTLNVNVTRFFPFKKLIRKTNALSRIGMTYSFEGKNQSSFGDSLLSDGNFNAIADRFQNGVKQNVNMQTTIGLFKNTWKISPQIAYSNIMNFQQTVKSYDTTANATVIDTVQRFGQANTLSITGQITTALYSYYRFIGKNQPLMRHVLTPTFSFTYIPALNKNLFITDSVGSGQTQVTYSPFERSVYNVSTSRDQALINFGFNNTFELKRKSDKDTLTGFKKTRLIEALTINGSYDLLKDSMNLSDIRLNLRVKPVQWLNIVANANFSPYAWNDTTGSTLGQYAVNTNGKLGRFTSSNFTTTVTFTSKEGRKELDKATDNMTSHWNADYEYYLLHPEYVVNFNIPWKISFSHVYTLAHNTNTTTYLSERYTAVQTLMMNGDISFTKRWKLVGRINMDLKGQKVTNARFSLTRDMHCWSLAFHWTPIGGNKSFLFSIRSTSNLLKDAKIDIKKPPAFL